MSARQVLFRSAAREKVLRGATQLADAVRVTLGPRSKSVLIQRKWGAPLVCNDGVTIAKEFELKDAEENLGAQMLRQAAERATKAELCLVLRFIENHSNWENSLPATYRLPALRCELTTATNALERLSHVVAHTNPPIPLLDPPKAYLERLQRRLDAIAAGKIGGFAPVVRSRK